MIRHYFDFLLSLPPDPHQKPVATLTQNSDIMALMYFGHFYFTKSIMTCEAVYKNYPCK